MVLFGADGRRTRLGPRGRSSIQRHSKVVVAAVVLEGEERGRGRFPRGREEREGEGEGRREWEGGRALRRGRGVKGRLEALGEESLGRGRDSQTPLGLRRRRDLVAFAWAQTWSRPSSAGVG